MPYLSLGVITIDCLDFWVQLPPSSFPFIDSLDHSMYTFGCQLCAGLCVRLGGRGENFLGTICWWSVRRKTCAQISMNERYRCWVVGTRDTRMASRCSPSHLGKGRLGPPRLHSFQSFPSSIGKIPRTLSSGILSFPADSLSAALE